jgi:SapC
VSARVNPSDIVFIPAGAVETGAWSRPNRFDFFDALLATPIADSELLHLSHYGPIAIRMDDTGPEVVMLLHSGFSTASLLSRQARWVPPYAPMALRSLPFRGTGFDGDLEFAPSLCEPAAEQHSFMDESGEPSPAFAYVVKMLQSLTRGRARLSQAAKALLAADLLAPLNPLDSHPHVSLFVPQAERLARLSGVQAAALTTDSNLPLELAAASLFSQRWLRKGCVQETPLSQDAPAVNPRHTAAPPSFHEDLDQPLLMDDSTLFSIEAYLGALGNSNGGA